MKAIEEDTRLEYVRARIANEPAYAYYVFCVIWGRQKPEERFTGQYMGSDGRGFWEGDTPFFNALFEDIEANGKRPSRGQAELLQERMGFYAKQYIRDCDERGVSVYSRGPKQPGHHAENLEPGEALRHKGKRLIRKGEIPEEQAKKMKANIDRMAERYGV
jgi:hypothetical protein